VTGIIVERWGGLRSASDERLRDLHAFAGVLHAEATPTAQRRTLEDFRASVRSMPDTYEVVAFVTRDASGVVNGWAEGCVLDVAENAHLAQASIDVRADARCRGIGRALLAELAEHAASRGRTTMIGTSTDRVPAGAAFAQRIGAREVQVSHEHRLVLDDVDRNLVDRWVSEAPDRAPGYSLLAVDGPIPDDLVDDVVIVYDAMNDAPRGDSGPEDEKASARLLRERERQIAATGALRWTLLVRNEASGRVVGLTEVRWDPAAPQTVAQGDTMVLAGHRGYALGKWLKAAMLKRILDELPTGETVRTNNADSNAAMVGINSALGFKPHIAISTWQVTVARVRTYLAQS
jgi:mycothiol synthase